MGFIHGGLAFDDCCIDGADLVREDDKRVTELDVGNFDVGEAFEGFFMRDAGHALGESVENTGGAFRSEFLEGAFRRKA
jgi:hypothetical protein